MKGEGLMSKLRSVIFSLLGLMLISGLLIAQESTGKIVGKVTDEEGIPLPGVTVEAESPRLVGKAIGVTDENGFYRLLALPPGTYSITFSLAGFKAYVRHDIHLAVEETMRVNISMVLGKIEERITVVGESPLIDVKSQARETVLTKDIFQLLPKGRDFASLIAPLPGVTDEAMLSGISVDGASGAENMFYVDGISTSDLVDGESDQDVSFDFAEEVLVKSSGYNAEYGGSLGGVINVITRSGGNEFHGELIGYFEADELRATERELLDWDFDTYETHKYYTYDEYAGKRNWTRLEAGFSLGGYIIKDRLWFFGSVMPKMYNYTRTLDFAIQGSDLKKDFDVKQTWMNAQIKLTSQLMQNLRVGASFISNWYKYEGDNEVWAYQASTTVDYGEAGFTYPNYSGSAYADLTLGNNALLSVRGGYWYTDRRDQVAPVKDYPRCHFYMDQPYSYIGSTNEAYADEYKAIGREDLVHGMFFSNYPWTMFYLLEYEERTRASVNSDFTYFANLGGEHAFKAGIQFVRQRENVSDVGAQPRIFLAWDSTFRAHGVEYGRGKYGWYSVRGNVDTGPYGDFYDASANRWALYVQDSWTIQDKLTLNFGVRTESEYLPNYSADPAYANVTKAVEFKFADKISPRFGFVYDVFGDANLKVFGSFGIFQDVMKLYMAANAFGGFKWVSAYYSLDTLLWDELEVTQTGTYYTKMDHRPPAFDDVEPGMKPFTQREIALGLEYKLAEDIVVSIRGVNKSVLHAIEDVGVVIPVYEDGVMTGYEEHYLFCNPGGDWIKEKYDESMAIGQLPAGTPYIPAEKRLYWGLNLSIDKRFSNNWLGGFNITLSRLTGNYTGLANSDEAEYDGLQQFGYARNDPNGERVFDLWYLMRAKNLDPIDGVLPTDRPIVVKAYGSYVFDFGLTLGAVVNAMSGTPLTERWNVDTTGYFPYNRGNMGRTPFLWFADLYAEYNLKLGNYTLQLSANVDNLFNVSTARFVDTLKYYDNISPGEEILLNNTNWEVPAGTTVSPLFNKEAYFYPPLNIRLGVKFIF